MHGTPARLPLITDSEGECGVLGWALRTDLASPRLGAPVYLELLYAGLPMALTGKVCTLEESVGAAAGDKTIW